MLSGKDNKFPRNSSGSMELVVVSKTRIFEQPSCVNSNYRQPRKDNGDAGTCTFDCRRTRYGYKRVSGVWSGGYRVSLGESCLENKCSLPPRHRYCLFPLNFQRFWDGFKSWKCDSDWRRARQGELSSSSSWNNSSLLETNPTLSVVENLPIWNKK